jgi:HEAT repeat protein
VLIAALDEEDEQVVSRALYALEVRGAGAELAIPKILWLMQNEKRSNALRAQAASSGSLLGPRADVMVPQLLQMLASDDLCLRVGAVRALYHLRSRHAGVVDGLLRALEDEHPALRCAAGVALGNLHVEPRRCVPALVKALQRAAEYRSEENDLPSRHVSQLLGAILMFGRDGEAAVPAVYDIAAANLASVRPGAFDLLERLQAVGVLGALGPKGQEKLRLMAADPTTLLGAAAARCLRSIERSERAVKPP